MSEANPHGDRMYLDIIEAKMRCLGLVRGLMVALLLEELERARPSIPFDIEPDGAFSVIGAAEADHRRRLKMRYENVRRWHALHDALIAKRGVYYEGEPA